MSTAQAKPRTLYKIEESPGNTGVSHYDLRIDLHTFHWTEHGLNLTFLADAFQNKYFMEEFGIFLKIHEIHSVRQKHIRMAQLKSRFKFSIDGDQTEYECDMSDGVAQTVMLEWSVYDESLLPVPNDSRFVFREAWRITHPYDGYVYLLRGVEGCYKIGKALNPVERIKKLGVVLPFPIATEHLIPCRDYSESEKSLHKKYKHRRIRGEWFALTPQDIADIKAIKEL